VQPLLKLLETICWSSAQQHKPPEVEFKPWSNYHQEKIAQTWTSTLEQILFFIHLHNSPILAVIAWNNQNAIKVTWRNCCLSGEALAIVSIHALVVGQW